MALPYSEKESGKKEQVKTMFNNIAHRYDFLNHFLSLGIDTIWRKKAIKLLKGKSNDFILDIATGTGDFAIEALKLNPQRVTGIDISQGMLRYGNEKLIKKGLQNKIELLQGDAENLNFPDASFNAIIAGFGVRNFENLEKGLNEMYRVLKDNGTMIILEFSKPETFPVKQFYNFYFRRILPLLGKFFSKDNSAYTYLPESVGEFPYGQGFTDILIKCNFKNCRVIPVSFGIASIYYCEK